MVLPTPLAPRSTRLRCSSTKSSVKARSITSRSIFLGQFQSKSAMGLKRPIRERSRRLSRERLAPSVSSRRTISSTTWRGEKRPLLARARKSSLPSAKATSPIWVSCSLRSGVFVVVCTGKLIVDLRLVGPDHEIGQIGTAREVDGQRRPGLGRAAAPLQQVGDGGDARCVTLEGLDQGGPEGLRVTGLVDVLVAVVGAAVSDDLDLAVQDAHRDR